MLIAGELVNSITRQRRSRQFGFPVHADARLRRLAVYVRFIDAVCILNYGGSSVVVKSGAATAHGDEYYFGGFFFLFLQTDFRRRQTLRGYPRRLPSPPPSSLFHSHTDAYTFRQVTPHPRAWRNAGFPPSLIRAPCYALPTLSITLFFFFCKIRRTTKYWMTISRVQRYFRFCAVNRR